jgi:hypothetical protein
MIIGKVKCFVDAIGLLTQVCQMEVFSRSRLFSAAGQQR